MSISINALRASVSSSIAKSMDHLPDAGPPAETDACILLAALESYNDPITILSTILAPLAVSPEPARRR